MTAREVFGMRAPTGALLRAVRAIKQDPNGSADSLTWLAFPRWLSRPTPGVLPENDRPHVGDIFSNAELSIIQGLTLHAFTGCAPQIYQAMDSAGVVALVGSDHAEDYRKIRRGSFSGEVFEHFPTADANPGISGHPLVFLRPPIPWTEELATTLLQQVMPYLLALQFGCDEFGEQSIRRRIWVAVEHAKAKADPSYTPDI